MALLFVPSKGFFTAAVFCLLAVIVMFPVLVRNIRGNRRQQVQMDENAIRRWKEHVQRVESMRSCGRPIQKCIKVAKEHPRNTYKYSPHCAAVHRCEKWVACCEDRSADCDAIKKELLLVELKQIGGDGSEKIVPIPFVNHTECGCVSKFARYHPLLGWFYRNAESAEIYARAWISLFTTVVDEMAQSVRNDFKTRYNSFLP